MTRNVASRGTYSMQAHGQSSRRSMPGFMVVKEGVPYEFHKPRWSHTHNVIRILPRFNPASQQFDPMRVPLTDDMQDLPYTDWIRRYDVAAKIGPSKFTWITRDPTDMDSVAQAQPLNTLFYAVQNAMKAGQADPRWVPFTIGQNAAPALSRPDEIYMVQAVVLMENSKIYNPPLGLAADSKQVLYVLPRSAGEALLNELGSKNPDGSFKYGDILDSNAGCYVDIRQAGTPSLTAAPVAQVQGGMGAMIQSGQGQSDNKYEVEIMSTFNGLNAALPQQLLQTFANRWLDWDSILKFPTVEEQVAYLCHCGFPANMLIYALSEQFGEFIPEATRLAAQQMNAAPLTMHGGPQFGGQPMAGQPGFGQPAVPGFGQPAAPGFGQPAAPGFGQPSFGQPAPQQQFGQQAPPQQPTFGNPGLPAQVGFTPAPPVQDPGVPFQQMGFGQPQAPVQQLPFQAAPQQPQMGFQPQQQMGFQQQPQQPQPQQQPQQPQQPQQTVQQPMQQIVAQQPLPTLPAGQPGLDANRTQATLAALQRAQQRAQTQPVGA